MSESHNIIHILPHEMLLSILRFVPHQNSVKAVSRSFRDMVHENTNHAPIQRNTLIASHFAGHSTWVVDPGRSELTQEEKEQGIKGPMHSIIETLIAMESGDSILLSAGYNHVLNNQDLEDNNELGDEALKCLQAKDVRIIGLGSIGKDRCTISDYDLRHLKLDDGLSLSVTHQLSLTNIACYIGINVKSGGCLWLTDSFLSFYPLSKVEGGGSFDAFGCRFEGDDESGSTFIDRGASVSLVGCRFDHCGGGKYAWPTVHITQRNETESSVIELKVIDCHFVNISAPPFAEYPGFMYKWLDDDIPIENGWLFRNNTCEGRFFDEPRALFSYQFLKKYGIQSDFKHLGLIKFYDPYLLIDHEAAVRTWLRDTVGLPEYADWLIQNDFDDLDKIARITMDDLEDMGNIKLEHRRQIVTFVSKLNLKR